MVKNPDGRTYTLTGVKDKTLIKAVIPDGVTVIGKQAFYKCAKMTTVVMPNTVTTIGMWAFANCPELRTVTFSKKLKQIDKNAFNGCYALATIDLPEGLESIGIAAFEYCKALTSVTLPQSVTTLGIGAFKNCSALKTLRIPPHITTPTSQVVDTTCTVSVKNDTVTSTKPNVSSSDLAAFEVKKSNNGKIITVTGVRDKRMTKATVPEGVTIIDRRAFSGCSRLESVELPEGLTTIGDGAFINCTALKEINIPTSVTVIGKDALVGCPHAVIKTPIALAPKVKVAISKGAQIVIITPKKNT